MSLAVLIVNGKRHLINEESNACEKHCKEIIKSYGSDAVVDFDTVKPEDVKRRTVKELIDG